MKKRWIPFLLKLFLPGLLALPWVLNIVLDYLPTPYYENNSWYNTWLEPIAFFGLLIAIISPLFLLGQKPKVQARSLAWLWFFFGGAILSSYWMPVKLFLEEISFVVVPLIVIPAGFFLILGYRSFYLKTKGHRVKSLRFHAVLVIIAILLAISFAIYWVIVMRISLFTNGISMMDFMLLTYGILEKCLYGISVLAAATHYYASIQQFRSRLTKADDLIEEIGSS